MPTLGTNLINLGPQDLAISVAQALPGAGANNTSGILDLQSIAPNGDAWRLGRIAVVIPAIPENVAGAGITFQLQAAPPSLLGGAGASAPNTPAPGAFTNGNPSQIITLAAVAGTGSVAQVLYFTLMFDANGSPYQFYQVLQTVPAQVAPLGESITYAFVGA